MSSVVLVRVKDVIVNLMHVHSKCQLRLIFSLRLTLPSIGGKYKIVISFPAGMSI